MRQPLERQAHLTRPFISGRIAGISHEEVPSTEKIFPRFALFRLIVGRRDLNRVRIVVIGNAGESFRVTNVIGRRIVELLPRLRRFAYALSGDPEKGDDLVQEACARAFAHLDQWQPGTRLDSWMYKIIHNIWRDQIRAAKVRGVTVDLDATPDLAGEDGRDVMNSRLTLRRVLDGLASLPETQQALITLISIEGLSYEDAAAVLGIPVGTATSRLVRGRRALYAIAIEGRDTPEGKNDEAL